MTAATAVLPVADGEDDQRLAQLCAAIEPEFLTIMSWSAETKVLTFPQDHPLLGWHGCAVSGCWRASAKAGGLCRACKRRWQSRKAEVSFEQFQQTLDPASQRSFGVHLCRVTDCRQPWDSATRGLCEVHQYQCEKVLGISVEEFLARSDVVGIPSSGPCAVLSCTRGRRGKRRYCNAHAQRIRTVRSQPGFDVEQWHRTAAPVASRSELSLRGLPPLLVAELIYGLQERVREGAKVPYWFLRPLVSRLRAAEAGSLATMPAAESFENLKRALYNGLLRVVTLLGMTPETERVKDVWNLAAWGLSGTLDFTVISQHWMRDAVKHWAYDDLPRRRGGGVPGAVRARVAGMAALSESLRLHRDDNGDLPAALGRLDVTAFSNRMAHLANTGKLTEHQRHRACLTVRVVLNRTRKLGLDKPGGPLHGLPGDFVLEREDVPDVPQDDQAGRDLPLEVMRLLCAHLGQLDAMGSREVRVAAELMIDTGRRPDEICQLDLDCLDRDEDGQPVLIYDNFKENRERRRLPIPSPTAALIVEQQEAVRARFPTAPSAALKLLPRRYRNHDGSKSVTDGWVTTRHREWVDSLPEVYVPIAVEHEGKLVTKMLPFDKAKIFPYAYRHSYAQRHADAGVDVTVLKELMDHDLLATTQRYYRVSEERRREAVDRVVAMQFDRHGNRVWRKAQALLDSEHARRAIGEVAVPYGGCTEPSNVAAGGHDCPLRWRCAGCGHFGTDISYLPDLERYLADLLRHRERLLALDADEWAAAEATPSDEEISRIRRLITRMKADLDDLTAEERAQIEQATTIVRQGRQKVVGLGMPRVRQPLPDVRPERTA